jgi:hypothetical protein
MLNKKLGPRLKGAILGTGEVTEATVILPN